MDAISESSDSLVSMHSEDSCASKSGACCYEHLERNSPTSLLPEHPFSAPVLPVTILSYMKHPQELSHTFHDGSLMPKVVLVCQRGTDAICRVDATTRGRLRYDACLARQQETAGTPAPYCLQCTFADEEHWDCH